MIKKNAIFIGEDLREQEAIKTLINSINAYNSNPEEPLILTPLSTQQLRDEKIFTRRHLVGSSGQMIDLIDSRPFSTDFSFTRFLVPYVADSEGIDGWVIFMDCDFLCLYDVSTLFKELEESYSQFPVVVVKKDFKSKNDTKMFGTAQNNYNKKLWSSFMCFNMKHKDFLLEGLSPDNVNTATGAWLHQFKWVANEDLIGGLPEQFQFIPEYDDGRVENPFFIHYTEKAPWFKGNNKLDPNHFASKLWRTHNNA